MTADSGDHRPDFGPWRAALTNDLVFKGFVKWADSRPYRILHRRRLTSGRSGSYVAVVNQRPFKGPSSNVIIKVLPPHIGGAEKRGVATAKQYTSRAFWADHMVETVESDSLPGTDWYVQVQEVADVDLDGIRPLADLIDEPGFPQMCADIITAIVEGWHRHEDPAEPWAPTPWEFLTRFLATHDGGLARFARVTGTSLNAATTEITLPGRPEPLPNPFALLAGTLGDLDRQRRGDQRYEIFADNGHNDLHLDNIMIPVGMVPGGGEIHAEHFRLVDFGRFSAQTPVSRDPVKLLLSTAGVWLRALRPGTSLRSNLAELVVSPQAHRAASPIVGYLDVAQHIHDAAAKAGDIRRNRAEWADQHRLLMIGSALRTVADTHLDLADRWWYLEVAALATRALLDDPGGRGAGHSPTPPSRAPAHDAPAHDAARPREPAGANRPAAEPVSPHMPPGTELHAVAAALGDSWRRLAEVLNVPAEVQEGFTAGREPTDMMAWLVTHGRHVVLERALVTIGRADLLPLLHRPG